jgi:hypothetical protein
MELPYKAMTDETARFTLAILLWLLTTEIVTGLMFFELPQANREMIIGLGGTIVGALVSSVNFYNKTGVTNDRQKDDTIHKLTATAASIQAQAGPTVEVLQPGEQKTVAAASDGQSTTDKPVDTV